MLKMPYGISDYRKIKEQGYCYVDKTMYLEKMENTKEQLVYLRPGRFGKSLFTSMMFYYYDISSKDLFESLFKDTYVYNNPTKNKNNYYVLKFDFSGISELGKTAVELEGVFKNKVLSGIERFNNNYNTSIKIDSSKTNAGMIEEFFVKYDALKLEHKLYIIIDEYDNFTNAILEGEGEEFKKVAGNNGFVKNFYATIKEYCGLGIVDRVFITGICPITLDSMTTGFNTATNISTDVRFNEMIGLTHDEVRTLIKDIDEDKQNEIFDLMIKNYDGYLFSDESKTRVFNATLVMYFLSNYYEFNKIPKILLDGNIAFNYGKIGNLLKLQNNMYYKEILDTILKTGVIESELKTRFNLEEDFSRDDFISLLFYFGYLTIKEPVLGGNVALTIPNYIMQELYTNYFLKLLRDIKINIDTAEISESLKEIVYEGKIDRISKYVEKILKLSDNKIFMKFDEKYVQLLYFSLLINKGEFIIYNEFQCENGFIDLMLLKNSDICKYDIMIELKYIKLKEYKKNRKLLKQKREEAILQLENYSKDERINVSILKRYVVIFIGNNLQLIEEI